MLVTFFCVLGLPFKVLALLVKRAIFYIPCVLVRMGTELIKVSPSLRRTTESLNTNSFQTF